MKIEISNNEGDLELFAFEEADFLINGMYEARMLWSITLNSLVDTDEANKIYKLLQEAQTAVVDKILKSSK